MPTETAGGHSTAPLFDEVQRRVESTLEHVHPVNLVAVAEDIRDRTTADYLADFDRLTADSARRGIQQPIIAYLEGSRYRVIDGETRRRAALMAGLETVPVLVYRAKPDQTGLKLASLLANSLRRGMTDQELAPLYQELMAQNGWGQAELARNVHVSPSKVSKVLAISNKLPEDLRAMVAAGTLPARAAYALSKLPDAEKQRELADKAAKGLLKVESLEELIRTLLGGGKGPKKDKPVKFSLPGITIVISLFDGEKIAAALALLDGALKRREKHALPWSSLPQLLRS